MVIVILNRFNIIIDYVREEVYLKPNKYFTEAFKFDRSGMSVIVTGEQLNKYIVLNVIKDSPAGAVDIRTGDEIRVLNGVPDTLRGLENILRSLLKKPGKRVLSLIKRGNERIHKEIRHRDLI